MGLPPKEHPVGRCSNCQGLNEACPGRARLCSSKDGPTAAPAAAAAADAATRFAGPDDQLTTAAGSHSLIDATADAFSNIFEPFNYVAAKLHR